MEPPRATVIVPLYIWPVSETTWQPLLDVITAHPNVNFLVIVNPNSGPGSEPLPGRDYEREVPKLNAAPNVETVGYVRVDYCRKPLHDACEEIDRFAGWSTQYGHEQPGLEVKGIYVDETPNHHSAGRALYLEALHKHIKATEGIGGRRLVLHNPGTPPDARLASPVFVDVIVTCEEPYERYTGDEVQKRLHDYHFDRRRSGYQISGIPVDQIGDVVRQLRHRGSYVFATDLVDDFYESFGESWRPFIEAMEMGEKVAPAIAPAAQAEAQTTTAAESQEKESEQEQEQSQQKKEEAQ